MDTDTRVQVTLDPDQLLQEHIGLICLLSKAYEPFGIERDALIQAGRIGLWKACKKYRADHPSGAQFTSYARYWIRQSIQRHCLETVDTVRMPEHSWRLHRPRVQTISLDDYAPGTENPIHSAIPAPESEEFPADQAAEVRAAVAALPPPLRVVVQKYYFDELNVNLIAADLDITHQAVSARLRKARAKLRQVLAPNFPRVNKVLTRGS